MDTELQVANGSLQLKVLIKDERHGMHDCVTVVVENQLLGHR